MMIEINPALNHFAEKQVQGITTMAVAAVKNQQESRRCLMKVRQGKQQITQTSILESSEITPRQLLCLPG